MTMSRLKVICPASSLEMNVVGRLTVDDHQVLTVARVDGTTQHIPLTRACRIEVEVR